MCNTKQSGANIKHTPKMTLRACKATNQEGNNTPTTSNLQEKKLKNHEIWKHELKESKMIFWI